MKRPDALPRPVDAGAPAGAAAGAPPSRPASAASPTAAAATGGLRRLLPDLPALRYTVHAGSNRLAEVAAALPWLLAPPADDGAVAAFERAVAVRCAMPHALAFGAGRMALWALLRALIDEHGWRPGDEVVLPAFTCAVVPNAMRYVGLVPRFADIDARTFNLDPAAAAAAVGAGARVRALYMQHTFGQACDVAALHDLAQRRGLVLIEDAAHSFGAQWHGRPHGSLGDVAFFSTDRTKVVNTHLGGVALVRDAALAERLRRLQQDAAVPSALQRRRLAFSFVAEALWRAPALFWLGRPVLGALRRTPLLFHWSDEGLDTLPPGYPYPSRMSGVQARLGLMQLSRLDANLAHRRRLAGWLEARLGAQRGVWSSAEFDGHAWLRYSLLVRDRAGFEARFGERIDLGTWFTTPIFGRADAQALGYEPGSCPVAEHVARHVVNLPTHPRLPLRALARALARHGAWLQGQRLSPVPRAGPSPADRAPCRPPGACGTLCDGKDARRDCPVHGLAAARGDRLPPSTSDEVT